jgi:Flp pilus assembly protein TadG
MKSHRTYSSLTGLRRIHGNALVIMAVGFSVFLLLAGTVVDFGTRFLARQQLQKGCDAAALGGAQELNNAGNAKQKAAYLYAMNISTNPPAQTPTTGSGGTVDTDYYWIGSDLVSITTPYTKSNSTVDASYLINVKAKRHVGLYFARMVGIDSIDVTASATAKRTTQVQGVIILSPSGSPALNMSGGSWLYVTNGPVIVNSSDPTAFNISCGGSGIQAQRIAITGGYNASGGSQNNLSPSPQTGVAATPDPLASLPAPSTSGLPTFPGGNYDGQTLQPGIYTSDVHFGTVGHLNPGIYILQGGISLSGGADLYGNGVMLYSLGPISLSGGSTLQLTPPTSGTYAGVTVFQARGNTAKADLSGGSASTLAGIYYFPDTQMLNLSGGSSMQIGTIVTWQMNLSGGSFQIGPIGSPAGSDFALVD